MSAIWTFIVNNRVTKWVLIALAAVLALLGRDAMQRRKGREQANEAHLQHAADEAARIQRDAADAERVQHDPEDTRGYRD